MRAIIFFAVYFGIGALIHALFLGSHIDWSSAWTYGVLLAWPAPMMLAVLGTILVAGFIEDWGLKRRRVQAMKKRNARTGG